MDCDLLFNLVFMSICSCKYLRQSVFNEALLLLKHLLLIINLFLQVMNRNLLLCVFFPHLVVGVDHVDLLFFEYVDHILGLLNEELKSTFPAITLDVSDFVCCFSFDIIYLSLHVLRCFELFETWINLCILFAVSN